MFTDIKLRKFFAQNLTSLFREGQVYRLWKPKQSNRFFW